MSEDHRFLLIKAWGCGFWSDMSHVAGQLLLAELTDRIPVIYWGADSLYSSDNPDYIDAFTMYFWPVSNYSVGHLENKNYTFYPSRWNSGNLRSPGYKDFTEIDDYPNRLYREENVLVSNCHVYIQQLQPFIEKNHPAYGWDVKDIYRYIYQKYLNLQPALHREIEDFYNQNMTNKSPILGVHIRSTDKIHERPDLHYVNTLYPNEINHFIENHPVTSIFMLTDNEKILGHYKNLYGDKLIYNEHFRSPNNSPPHYSFPSYNNRQKGIDIIKDTYLAMKCDYFIGNGGSNVSLEISRLKNWPEGTIKLL
jgi:hypothetical protein